MWGMIKVFWLVLTFLVPCCYWLLFFLFLFFLGFSPVGVWLGFYCECHILNSHTNSSLQGDTSLTKPLGSMAGMHFLCTRKRIWSLGPVQQGRWAAERAVPCSSLAHTDGGINAGLVHQLLAWPPLPWVLCVHAGVLLKVLQRESGGERKRERGGETETEKEREGGW